jgi:AraC-like DNA-binding protein
MVDIHSDRYMIARRYMLRLRKDDFEDPSELAKFASVLGISLEEFQEQFAYLVEHEPEPRSFVSDAPEGVVSERLHGPIRLAGG